MSCVKALLNLVSDEDLKKAYANRFRVPVGRTFNNSSQVADHLATYLNGRDRETFVVLFLNRRHALISTEVLFEGTLTQAVIHPREIVKYALLKNASAIICGHNHPSGNNQPSNDDRAITVKIKHACDLIEVALIDHIIIGDGEWFSFADKNLIPKGGAD